MMLLKLVSAQPQSHDVEVVSLTDKGVLGAKIEQLGIPVCALNMPRGRPSFRGLIQLALMLHRDPSAIIHCWMYHGNLVGGVAACLGGRLRAKVIWGIRNSVLDPATTSRSTLLAVRAGALLSRVIPSKIVCCSERARAEHEHMGYQAGKMLVIPNGFDTEKFKPDEDARIEVRRELGLSGTAQVIGLFARYDPQKDHRTFVAAALKAAERFPQLHFILSGEGIVASNAELAKLIAHEGIADRIHLLGRRQDMPRLMAALDVATLSSAYGEAFPNVLGEAMACAVPCVATDVGDSADIIGDTGRVVAPRRPDQLADAWGTLLNGGTEMRHALGQAARARVLERFDLTLVAARYERLYEQLAAC
jgi:glycosyltransferase involved in cell wall biosynthesis